MGHKYSIADCDSGLVQGLCSIAPVGSQAPLTSRGARLNSGDSQPSLIAASRVPRASLRAAASPELRTFSFQAAASQSPAPQI